MTAAFTADRPARPPVAAPASVKSATGSCATASTTANRTPAHPGLFARIGKALIRANVRAAERRAGDYLQSHGGRLTDQLERRILDDVTGNGRGSFRF